jgi:hypothetical protein
MANRNLNIHTLCSPGSVQHPTSGITELAAVLGSPDSLGSMLAAADTGFGEKGSFGGKAAKRAGSTCSPAAVAAAAASGLAAAAVEWVLTGCCGCWCCTAMDLWTRLLLSQQQQMTQQQQQHRSVSWGLSTCTDCSSACWCCCTLTSSLGGATNLMSGNQHTELLMFACLH